MRDDVLRAFIEELSHSSPHTVSDRKFYATKFLEFAGDDLSKWNKQTVADFIKQLEAEEYASGTIRKIYGICKRCFDAAKTVHEAERVRLISTVDPKNPEAVAEVLEIISLPGPDWDLGKRSAPPVVEEVKPELSLEEVEKMVGAAKSVLALPEICYLALSSIYGLRCGELCAVRKEHLDFDAKTIFVLTEKGGERRQQLLCEEIIPILRSYNFETNFSHWQMSAMWWRVCSATGVNLGDGSGWDSFRRTISTILRPICGSLDIKIFLRWKISASSDMTERNFSGDVLEADARVLEMHPIVRLWS